MSNLLDVAIAVTIPSNAFPPPEKILSMYICMYKEGKNRHKPINYSCSEIVTRDLICGTYTLVYIRPIFYKRQFREVFLEIPLTDFLSPLLKKLNFAIVATGPKEYSSVFISPTSDLTIISESEAS